MFNFKKLWVLFGLIILFSHSIFANVSIIITTPSNEVNVSDSVDYSLAITNDGLEIKTDLQIQYIFSPSMVIGTITGGTCANGTCTLDELGVGDTATITIPITVPNTVHDVESNAITLTASNDGNPFPNDAVALLKPNLSTSITPSLNEAVIGQQLIYEVEITNDGTGTATGTKIQHGFPDVANIVIGEIVGAGWNCNATTCELIGNLDAGITKTITFPITAPNTIGQLKFITTVTGDNEPTGDSETDTSVTVYPAAADLSIEQTVSDDAVVKDGNFRYNFIIKNAGPGTAQNVSVEIELLGNSDYVSAITDDAWECSAAGQIITCNLTTDLANGDDSSLSIEVKGESGGLSNNATVSSNALDDNEENNTSVSQPEVVVFTYGISPKTGVAGDTVVLKANSDVNGLSFAWQYGEQCVVGEDTEIDINSSGVSLVSLALIRGGIDAESCELIGEGSKVIKRIEEQVVLDDNIPPAAQLEITPQSLTEPGSVTLDASKSTDSRNEQTDSGIVGYKFSYNGTMIPADGSWLENSTYNLPLEVIGIHTITVFVKDTKGGISSATSQVIVGKPNLPYAAFDVAPGRMDAPVSVTLNAVPNDLITEYLFTITNPNGSPINVGSNTSQPNKTVNFPITGNYRVNLRVFNALREYSDVSKDIYIGGIKPSSATVTPTKGQEPHTVTLKANPPSNANDFASCKWTIYDKFETVEIDCFKNTNEFEEKLYIFRDAGEFTVDLEMADVNGDISPVNDSEVIVYEPGTPKPTLDVPPVKGFSPLTVQAIATATDSNSMDKINIQWESLGSYSEITKTGRAGGTFEEKTAIEFTGAGDYNVKITATDTSKASLTAELEKTVTVFAPPEITNIDDIPIGCSLLTTNFGVSYSDPHIDYLQYEWSATNGGQANPGNGPSTFITFPENTDSIVTLTITDNNGTEKVVTKLVSTRCDNQIPEANMAFVGQTTKGFSPFTITAKDQYSYDPDNTIDPLEFRWIAETAHSIESPFSDTTSIIFNTSGEHNIKLNVSDSIVNVDSVARTVTVIAPPTITASVDKVCQSESVTFSVPQEQGFSYVWSSANSPDASSNTSAFVVAFEQVASPKIDLQITDANGTSVNVTKMITVLPESAEQCTTSVEPVQAKIIPVQSTVQVNNTLSFDGSKLSTGPIVSYEWSANSSSKCQVAKCNIKFDTVGSYSITLIVRGEDGVPSDDTVLVEVVEPTVKPSAKLKVPNSVKVGDSVNLDGSSSNGPVDMGYKWFVNGSPLTCVRPMCVHTFGKAGSYNVEIEVYTQDDKDSKSSTITVTAIPIIDKPPKVPTVAIISEQLVPNDDGTETKKLTLDAGNNPDIAEYKWSIIDENNKVVRYEYGNRPTINLDEPGDFSIELTVTDKNGINSEPKEVAKVTGPIIIDEGADPSTIPPVVPAVGIANEELVSNNNGKTTKTVTLNVADNPDIIEYKWIIHDNEGQVGEAKYGEKPNLSFDKPEEEYTVYLEVKGKNGISNGPKEVKKVMGPPKLPDIPEVTVVKEEFDDDGNMQVALDISEDASDDVEYQWKASNGDTASGKTANFSFSEPGKYGIELIATKDGVSSLPKLVKTVTVPEKDIVVDDIPTDKLKVEVPTVPYSEANIDSRVITLDATSQLGSDIDDKNVKWIATNSETGEVIEVSGKVGKLPLPETGVYTITLQVEEDDVITAQSVVTTIQAKEGETMIGALGMPPQSPVTSIIAVADVEPRKICPGGQIRLDCRMSSGDIKECKWKLKDSEGYLITNYSGIDTTVSIDQPVGSYSIVLNVVGEQNGSSVSNDDEAIINVDDCGVNAGYDVTLFAKSKDDTEIILDEQIDIEGNLNPKELIKSNIAEDWSLRAYVDANKSKGEIHGYEWFLNGNPARHGVEANIPLEKNGDNAIKIGKNNITLDVKNHEGVPDSARGIVQIGELIAKTSVMPTTVQLGKEIILDAAPSQLGVYNSLDDKEDGKEDGKPFKFHWKYEPDESNQTICENIKCTFDDSASSSTNMICMAIDKNTAMSSYKCTYHPILTLTDPKGITDKSNKEDTIAFVVTDEQPLFKLDFISSGGGIEKSENKYEYHLNSIMQLQLALEFYTQNKTMQCAGNEVDLWVVIKTPETWPEESRWLPYSSKVNIDGSKSPEIGIFQPLRDGLTESEEIIPIFNLELNDEGLIGVYTLYAAFVHAGTNPFENFPNNICSDPEGKLPFYYTEEKIKIDQDW